MRMLALGCALAGCASHAPAPSSVAASHAVELRAVDADGGRLRDVLALDLSYVAPAVSVRVTGQFEGRDPRAVRDQLIAAYPALAVPPFRGGHAGGEVITLDFRDAEPSDVLRLLASVLKHDLVVAPGVPRVDAHVKGQPAGDVLEAAAAALQLQIDHTATVSYLHPRGTPGLGAFVETGGAIALSAKDAHAGELDALLAVVGGAAGDAACDAGAPIQVDLVRASAAGTAAVLAVLSGASGGHCALPIVTSAPADATLIASARVDGQQAALYRAGAAAVIMSPSSDWLLEPVDDRPTGEIIANGRPAAVIVTPDRTRALYQLDGAWAFGDAEPGLAPR